MKITAVKADYMLEVTKGFRIRFSIENAETMTGRLIVEDDIHHEKQSWDKALDPREKLCYGLLDELIENMIFQTAEGISRADDMLAGYRMDEPEVAWMSNRKTFEKVICGQSVFDRRTFLGEILGDCSNGKKLRLLLFNNRKAQVFMDGELMDVIELPVAVDKNYEETLRMIEERFS